MNDNRKVQFSSTRYRGYNNEDGSPKNPFEDQSFLEAHLEYVKRNQKRRSAQQARKRKKEEELVRENKKKKMKRVVVVKEQSKSQ